MSEHASRVGLVGCVKKKGDDPAPAQELYTSTLFRGRRAFVDESCDVWFILSAKHGLVAPDEVLAPYDESLTVMTSAARREWAQRVLAQIDALGVTPTRTTFEIHAGSSYRNFGLTSGLEDRGARVEVIAEHLGQGEQLAFYGRRPSPEQPMVSTNAKPSADPARSGPYEPLAHFLAHIPERTTALSFSDLEGILLNAALVEHERGCWRQAA